MTDSLAIAAVVRSMILGLDGMVDAGKIEESERLVIAIGLTSSILGQIENPGQRAEMIRQVAEILPSAVEFAVEGGIPALSLGGKH